MCEVEDIREIEEPYEGDWNTRLDDLAARITWGASDDPKELVMAAGHHLREFALQHVREPEGLWREWVAPFP